MGRKNGRRVWMPKKIMAVAICDSPKQKWR
jgi:hypothetical protein